MLFLITGASGSGKSEYAEKLTCALAEKENLTEKIYLATMENNSETAKQRIQRHQRLRKGKGFKTVESPFGLTDTAVAMSQQKIILLECVSNLLANLMFQRKMTGADAVQEILFQVEKAESLYGHIIVVTNEIFSDGSIYTGEMREYMNALGMANCQLAKRAKMFCEVVYSVPVFLKGEAICLF